MLKLKSLVLMFLSLLGLLPAPDQAAEAQTKRPKPRSGNPYQQTESKHFPWRAIVEVESTFTDSDPINSSQALQRTRLGLCYWGNPGSWVYGDCAPLDQTNFSYKQYCTGLMIGPRHVLMAGDCKVPVGSGNVYNNSGTFEANVYPYGMGIRGDATKARVIRSTGNLLYLDKPIGRSTHWLVLEPREKSEFSASFLGFYNYKKETAPSTSAPPNLNPLNLQLHRQYIAPITVKTNSSICNGQPYIEVPTKALGTSADYGNYEITYMRGFVVQTLPQVGIYGSSGGTDANNSSLTCLSLFNTSADYASIIDWMRQNP